MRLFRLSVLLAATCLTIGHATAATVQELPGYSRLTVSSTFEAHLTENPALVSQLAAQPELSKLILSRASLQQQLVEGKVTVDALRAQYFPQEKIATTDKDPSLFSRAQALLQRAIGAAESENAQNRAATDIANTLNNASTDNGDTAAQTINDTAALLAFLRANPDRLDDILSNPDILARLEQAGIDPDELRTSANTTDPDRRGATTPPSSSSGGTTPPSDDNPGLTDPPEPEVV